MLTVVIYCYLEKENYKLLELYVNDSSYFEISASIFWALPSNKLRTLHGVLIGRNTVNTLIEKTKFCYKPIIREIVRSWMAEISPMKIR